jgi:hypothetical protein
LAVCCHEESIGDYDAAREYLRELAGASDAHWSEVGWNSLRTSLSGERKEERDKWLGSAPSPKKVKSGKALERERFIAALAGEILKAGNPDVELDRFTNCINEVFTEAQSALDVLNGKTGGISAHYGLDRLAEAFYRNKSAQAQAVLVILPVLETNFPPLIPHFLAAAVSYQVGTNAAVIADFRASLARAGAHPEMLLGPQYYFNNLAFRPYLWCIEKKHYELALAIQQAKLQAAARSSEIKIDDRDQVRLGFAYLGLQNWNDAISAFKQAGEKPIEMDYSGPWGDVFHPFDPSKVVASCREKLGQSA